MTPKEIACLKYLYDKMEATAEMVGIAITPDDWPFDSRRKSGGVILGRLRYTNLVMHLSDLNAWRLTRAGRELVTMARALEAARGGLRDYE